MPNRDLPISPWARWLSAGLFTVSAALLLLSLVVVAYNARYSTRRIAEIFNSDARATSASKEATAISAVPAWVRPLMKDLSLVSPGLVAYTFACTAFAALLLLRSPSAARRLRTAHFPFPTTYKTYYIQMGLLGTIVGFVIAFSEIDPDAERQSLVLLEALGTALWSTLTALLLAYGACPLLELLYQRMRDPGKAHASPDTRSALDILRERTDAAAESLAKLTGAVDSLGDQVNLRQMESRLGRLEDGTAALAAQVQDLAQAARQIQTRADGFEREGRDTRTIADDARRDLSELDRRLQMVNESVTSLTAVAAEMKSAVEILREEGRAAREDRARLDSLERRLAAIVQTFRSVPE